MNDRMDLADTYRALSAAGFAFRPSHNDWFKVRVGHEPSSLSDEQVQMMVRDWPLLVPCMLEMLNTHTSVSLERLASLNGLRGVQLVPSA